MLFKEIEAILYRNPYLNVLKEPYQKEIALQVQLKYYAAITHFK